MSRWGSSSLLCTPKPAVSKKRGAESFGTADNRIKKVKKLSEDGTWCERFEPHSRDELAVHKKKIDEVNEWLKHNTLVSELKKNSGKAPILLILGPTGSGKSVTLKILAKENGVHVKEWMHPLTVGASGYVEDGWKYVSWDEAPREKIIDNLTEFLFQGSRYKSLFEEDSRRIIVLEDIPSAFLKHTEDFHDCLRKYRRFGRCSLVILLCETPSSREFKLFPPELKTELGIRCISFNPVATTLLRKAIKGIIHQAYLAFGTAFRHLAEAEVDSVIQHCDGDLRMAVNLLQIASMRDSKIVTNFDCKKKKKEQKNNKEEKGGDTRKDSSLYLFHSLGKILYAKREDNVVHELAAHLKCYEKPPLKENPEAVFDRTCVSQDLFIRMLHNNASNVYASIDSAANCLEWFSLGDYFGSVWDPTGCMNSFGLSTTLRGLMYHLEKPKEKTYFGTFKKPILDRKKVENRLDEVRHQFLIQGASVDVLVSDILPYMFKIKPKNLSQEQWKVINDCVFVRKAMFSSQPAERSFSEKFVPEEDEADEDAVSNIPEKKEIVMELVPPDEIEIEEIDSD
ncbi:cell cycle checkpoint protein RAD17-like isoform X2 [Varroa destructor]|nr:cell cycle checkpoint protein RAD17-like isoform X2 [Varroa destructor]XP_022649019.1 cell cycle checkpoint protein RAD17-like isoform X2 [Varroa destructor]XP_022649021.1 cell cycle checkpoint protein RAD17-like isoform X2 [Varroa destructor]